ncbi:DgyrCDS3384 [Dimorphilus gyrociliatus]|uniref:DgyrCDS3384 n=1 Tax=Dimorphilus gyrociliatus TaxID=2664684 RepID=A0A7I8VD17_9ANNE|nr:DgyrCDS3384 [Dimorphilus gyrociliatus]
MQSVGRQFLLLIWKNWLIQKRKIFLTAFEIFLPVIFAIIFFGVRQLVDSKTVDKHVIDEWQPFSVERFYRPDLDNIVLLYSPKNTETNSIINNVKEKLNLKNEGRGFEKESDLESYVENLSEYDYKYSCAIVFTNMNSSQLPTNIKYKLRMPIDPEEKLGPKDWFTKYIVPRFQSPRPVEKEKERGGPPEYADRGYLSIQYAVDMAIIKQLASNTEKVDVKLRRILHPPYVDDGFLVVLQLQLPFFILLSYIITVPSIVKDIVLEKELRLKESMKMMGLKNWLHWSAWITKYFLFMFISVLFYTLFFSISTSKGAVLNQSHPTCTLVFLILYTSCTISYSCMISTFFTKANSGAAAGGIIFFATYIPYFFLSSEYQTLNKGIKFASSLFHNLAMGYGCTLFSIYEGTGEGVQWSNLASYATNDENFRMLDVFIMLIVDTFLYGIITWYVDNINPGEFGIPKPWYFFCTKWYWCGGSQNISKAEDSIPEISNMEMFEKVENSSNPGIKIKNLRKEFKSGGKKKVAVKGTIIDMYEGQITALLGHNGAGKTTTMNMLTGFIPPTSGSAVINGFDIRTDIDRVRESLGLCPQHDILFDNLTVEEHLIFFASLKGCPKNEIDSEVSKMIDLLRLEDKTRELASTLSGGQKRKLSVGIALINNSKIVILDEPTSGMDPEARRQTWDILQSQRAGRTMILSTHFMDEADLLGDRIAIMADGIIQCCGSSLFLKSKYGVGYHMTIVKTPECDVTGLTKVIKNFVEEAKIESNISAELSFILPQKSTNKFEAMFKTLEENKESLGINSFGASVTTMEEVFLKVGESLDADLASRLQGTNANSLNNQNETTLRNSSITLKRTLRSKTSGATLWFQQFLAIFIKKAIYSSRNKILTIVQLLIPTLFTILAVVIVKRIEGRFGTDLETIELTPGMFQRTITYAETDMESYPFLNGYKSFIQQGTFQEVNDLIESLKTVSENMPVTYNKEYMLAAKFSKTGSTVNITSYFNAEAYHTCAIAVSGATNSIFKKVVGTSRSITASNQPLPYLPNARAKAEVGSQSNQSLIIVFTLMFGIAFLIASFSVFIVKEKSVKAKHSQFISGVKPMNYWLSTFTWDFINFLFPALCVIAVIGIGQIDGYVKDGNLGKVFLLFILFALSVLPFTYLISTPFKVSASAFAWLSVINILTGISALLAVSILSLEDLGTENIAKGLGWLFSVFLPHYCFGSGMMDIFNNFHTLKVCLEDFNQMQCKQDPTHPCCSSCNKNCLDYEKDYFSFNIPGIGRPVAFMIFQGIIYMSITVFLESDLYKQVSQIIFHVICNPRRHTDFIEEINNISYEVHLDSNSRLSTIVPMNSTRHNIDSDVLAEKKRLSILNKEDISKNHVLALVDIHKYYEDFHAVCGLSVGVCKGECFGLLGVNGAGKTTTFKMLTGDENISSGNAWIDGHNVINSMEKVQKSVGYCPQFDALIDQMTVTETLYLYARLRGLHKNEIAQAVDELVDSLLLRDHKDKETRQLSGGNKRKLSTAIAFMGDPPVVFLDEPTTGMDPVARRLLWDTLTQARARGTSLVLTSHSMEECEALCTQMGIMVNGEFKCLGSTQHLKSKFGEGYTVLAKVQCSADNSYSVPDVTQALMNFIEQSFMGAELKDSHDGYVHYQISDKVTSWASIFGSMERVRDMYHLEDYSVSQTTLEQVFINFARQQRSPEHSKVGCKVKCTNCLKFFCCKCCKF